MILNFSQKKLFLEKSRWVKTMDNKIDMEELLFVSIFLDIFQRYQVQKLIFSFPFPSQQQNKRY